MSAEFIQVNVLPLERRPSPLNVPRMVSSGLSPKRTPYEMVRDSALQLLRPFQIECRVTFGYPQSKAMGPKFRWPFPWSRSPKVLNRSFLLFLSKAQNCMATTRAIVGQLSSKPSPLDTSPSGGAFVCSNRRSPTLTLLSSTRAWPCSGLGSNVDKYSNLSSCLYPRGETLTSASRASPNLRTAEGSVKLCLSLRDPNACIAPLCVQRKSMPKLNSRRTHLVT